MRVREISYSKKIGLPNYGSLGLTVTAELETNDAFDDAYQDLKGLVDTQLDGVITGSAQQNGNGHSNGNGYHQPNSRQVSPSDDRPTASDGEPATTKQMELVRKLCKEQNRRAPAGSLSRSAASQLINELLESGKGTPTGRSNGSGNNYPAKRQAPFSRGGNGGQEAEKMTEGQRRYLYRLLSDQGYRGNEATERVKEILGVESLNQITKERASYEIEGMVQRAA